MKFQANIRLSGKSATGIPVPGEVLDALGAGKRPAVRVTLAGYTYRSTVGAMDGEYMIPLSAEHRTAAGVAPGQDVDVEVELDQAPREVEVPKDFAAALDAEPEAKRFFDGLSYSLKRYHVLQVEGARAEDTRRRRIEKSVDLLRQGKAR